MNDLPVQSNEIEYGTATAQEIITNKTHNKVKYDRKKDDKNSNEKRIFVAPRNNRSKVKQQFTRIRRSNDWHDSED